MLDLLKLAVAFGIGTLMATVDLGARYADLNSLPTKAHCTSDGRVLARRDRPRGRDGEFGVLVARLSISTWVAVEAEFLHSVGNG